jgi:hypothetical protein
MPNPPGGNDDQLVLLRIGFDDDTPGLPSQGGVKNESARHVTGLKPDGVGHQEAEVRFIEPPLK